MKDILRKKIKAEQRLKNMATQTFKRPKPVPKSGPVRVMIFKIGIPADTDKKTADTLQYLMNNNIFYISDGTMESNESVSRIKLDIWTNVNTKGK